MEIPWLWSVFIGTAYLVYKLSRIGIRPSDYPPGPPTLPLLGNLHLMPKKDPHLQFQKWAIEYGQVDVHLSGDKGIRLTNAFRPVYSLMLGTQVMIVLSSDQVVKDLLDKRSNIYSSRPDMYLGRMVGGGLRMVLMSYGEKWRSIHKKMHGILNLGSAKTYTPYQDLENKQMLFNFLESPEHFEDHIRRYTHSLTTQMIYGFRTSKNDDPRLKKLYTSVERWSQVMGSTTGALLDMYPILRNLPDLVLPARRMCREYHRQEKELFVGLWHEAKQKIGNGTALPSFCDEIVKAQKREGFSDDQAGYISSTLLEAGSDTTSAELTGFVQAMVVFPEIQQIARAELDRVCGDRLPTFDDDLPYIRCCVKESLRWMPTVVTGLPHAVVKDDEYMGYRIPKDAFVMYNTWTINMDPKRHPNPRVYNPSRYEGDLQTSAEACSNPDASKRDHFGFGAGRRVCQGMHVAERSLFIAVASLLWAFRFERAVGADGEELVPDPDALTQGALVRPLPFPARIVPRSERHARTVAREWEACQQLLDAEKQWREIPAGLALARLARK